MPNAHLISCRRAACAVAHHSGTVGTSPSDGLGSLAPPSALSTDGWQRMTTLAQWRRNGL